MPEVKRISGLDVIMTVDENRPVPMLAIDLAINDRMSGCGYHPCLNPDMPHMFTEKFGAFGNSDVQGTDTGLREKNEQLLEKTVPVLIDVVIDVSHRGPFIADKDLT